MTRAALREVELCILQEARIQDSVIIPLIDEAGRAVDGEVQSPNNMGAED